MRNSVVRGDVHAAIVAGVLQVNWQNQVFTNQFLYAILAEEKCGQAGVQIAYYEGKQIIAAWCCLRGAFRNFRIDRIITAAATERRYGERRAVLATRWRRLWEEQHPDWARGE